MICDFHMHTEFSGDSETPVRAQVERAIELGMKEICITDHHDYDSDFCETDFNLDIPPYLESLAKIREEYRDRILVNIGIELGLQPHLKQYLDSLADQYGGVLDFIIGSCHFADRLDPFADNFWAGRTEAEAFRRFLTVSLENAATMDCYDVFGHLDYVVRYAPHQNQQYSYGDFHELIDAILREIIGHGKGLECNTGGLKYGLGHPNPTEEVLVRYRELGGEILTVGSDAHKPEHLGFEFERCRELLKGCGFKYYTVFHGRKPVFLPL